MSTVSGAAAASVPQTFEAAMLRKAKEQTELEGEANVALIESAASATNPEGTATIIDDVA